MTIILIVLLLAAIAAAAIFSNYLERDGVKIRIDARVFPKQGDLGSLQIELRNFGPRTARIDKVVIDGDVYIVSVDDNWTIERNTIHPEPLEIRAIEVTFVRIELRRFYNAKAVWAHGSIVETGAAWSSKAAIIQG